MSRLFRIITIAVSFIVVRQSFAVAVKAYTASSNEVSIFGISFQKHTIKKYKHCRIGNKFVAVFQLAGGQNLDIAQSSDIKRSFITSYRIVKHGKFLVLNVQLSKNVQYCASRCSSSAVNVCVRNVAQKRVVVIDPGHGGKDSGAVRRGAKGKDITLAMANDLKRALEKTNRYAVYLTRDSDVFVSSKDRVIISEKRSPDVFVSLHTSTTKNQAEPEMRVYTYPRLSKINDKSDITEVSSALFINYAAKESRSLANKFLRYMQQTCKINKNAIYISKAAVLKNKIPSVLIELGGIANAKDNASFSIRRECFVNSLVRSIDDFLGKK